jgi:hypothetical protein
MPNIFYDRGINREAPKAALLCVPRLRNDRGRHRPSGGRSLENVIPEVFTRNGPRTDGALAVSRDPAFHSLPWAVVWDPLGRRVVRCPTAPNAAIRGDHVPRVGSSLRDLIRRRLGSLTLPGGPSRGQGRACRRLVRGRKDSSSAADGERRSGTKDREAILGGVRRSVTARSSHHRRDRQR